MDDRTIVRLVCLVTAALADTGRGVGRGGVITEQDTNRIVQRAQQLERYVKDGR